jgi:hypothetical protein
VALHLQTSSLPTIKRERVVRVGTLCRDPLCCDCDEICRSSFVSCDCGPTLDCPVGLSFYEFIPSHLNVGKKIQTSVPPESAQKWR